MLCLLPLLQFVSPQDSFPPDNIQSLLSTVSDVEIGDLIPENSTSSLPTHVTTVSSHSTAFSTVYSVPSYPLPDVQIDYLTSNVSDFDFVEYHLRRYLNHRYSPCTDFFRFTCDYDQIGNNSLVRLSEDFYQSILLSTSPLESTQIDNDLLRVDTERGNSSLFSSIEYSMALTDRCASNQSCFADEFKLTYTVYNFLMLNSTLLLKAGFNASLVDKASPDKLEHLSTQLHQAIDNVTDLKTALLLYEGVRRRMRVMERLEGRKESLAVIVAKTRELAIQLAQGLLDKFNRTQWLHVPHIFNLPTFIQFSTILQNMTLRTDLDETFDFNMTAQSLLLQHYLSYYNFSNENDLGSLQYTIKFSLLYATCQLSSQLRGENRGELLFRLSHPLLFSTGNIHQGIVLTAPSFFPLISHLRPESLLGSLGTSISRELVYRFVNPKYTRRSSEYSLEYEGISQHLYASCALFAQNATNCSQLRSLIQEYVADLEGISLSYELMTRSIDYDELHKQPYSDLPFTSEQLFFIAHSITQCRDSAQLRSQRVNAVVRVNGALSQMPEFARAFDCAKGDAMTTE